MLALGRALPIRLKGKHNGLPATQLLAAWDERGGCGEDATGWWGLKLRRCQHFQMSQACERLAAVGRTSNGSGSCPGSKCGQYAVGSCRKSNWCPGDDILQPARLLVYGVVLYCRGMGQARAIGCKVPESPTGMCLTLNWRSAIVLLSLGDDL